MSYPSKPDRNAAMVAMRERGASYRAIGAQFGVSRARAHTIVQRERTRKEAGK